MCCCSSIYHIVTRISTCCDMMRSYQSVQLFLCVQKLLIPAFLILLVLIVNRINRYSISMCCFFDSQFMQQLRLTLFLNQLIYRLVLMLFNFVLSVKVEISSFFICLKFLLSFLLSLHLVICGMVSLKPLKGYQLRKMYHRYNDCNCYWGCHGLQRWLMNFLS